MLEVQIPGFRHLCLAPSVWPGRLSPRHPGIRSSCPPKTRRQKNFCYVEKLGAERCVAIGNGRNDRLMLEAAALGIAVMQQEGAAVEAMLAADIVVPDIGAALELLLHTRRLIATLRS